MRTPLIDFIPRAKISGDIILWNLLFDNPNKYLSAFIMELYLGINHSINVEDRPLLVIHFKATYLSLNTPKQNRILDPLPLYTYMCVFVRLCLSVHSFK